MCLLLTALVISPRIILFILWLVDYTEKSFNGHLLPFLGFLLMPWTTFWCAIVWHNGQFGLISYIILFFCILADFGGHTAMAKKTSTKK